MPNPRAQRPLTLDQAVSDIKNLAQPARAMGDMMASALRGSVAATAGLPGDIRELIDLFGPEAVERVLGKRVMPTTEEMKAMLPKATSYDNPYESIGEFLPLPGTGSALKAAGYGLGRGAGALTRAGAEAINNAHLYGQGPLAAITPQPMRMFIGPQAKTFDAGRAAKADEMLKAGASPQEVWKATGTMIGKDGIPRQEISDAASIFRRPGELKELAEANKQQIALRKEQLKPSKQKDLFPKQLTEAKRPVRAEVEALKEDVRQMSKNPRTQGVAAKWTLEHPELYRAYPELADITVTQKPTVGAEKGSLSTLGGIIQDLEVKEIKDPRSVALHEMQHAIQNIEGMGAGANPMMAFSTPEWRKIYESYKAAEMKGMKPGETLSVKDEDRLAQKAANRWYQLQHGEAEARATQQRQYRTPSERLESFPHNDFDVNPDEMLIRKMPPFLGVSKQSSIVPDDLKRLHEEFRIKAEQDKALQDAYNKATRHMPLNERPTLDEFRATNVQSSQADLDQMRLDLDERGMAGGGAAKGIARFLRAPAKSKEEIKAIAERMAPQVTGEYVRKGEKDAQTVAGKTQRQFEREKTLPVDIRPMGEVKTPEKIDIESLKGSTFMGIPGDYTVTGKRLHGVGDVSLESPAPQHGGPLYGLYRDDAHFWASQKDAAGKVQNLAKRLEQEYDAPVIGNYIMMGPEAMNYAQHFADANLQAINLSKMSKRDLEKLNNEIRKGSAESGPRPAFPGIEDKGEAYLWFSQDPALRKHFNATMQKEKFSSIAGLPSSYDIRFAVTEPELRDLERGITGYSMGRMNPSVSAEGLKLSEHPTYSHDIPGHFMGQSKYPTPYEMSFPDIVKSIRENPRQAPHEFGTFQYSGPHQVIDQQMIDEIKQYEEMMKALTGKKKGGQVEMAQGGEITAEDLEIEERPL